MSQGIPYFTSFDIFAKPSMKMKNININFNTLSKLSYLRVPIAPSVAWGRSCPSPSLSGFCHASRLRPTPPAVQLSLRLHHPSPCVLWSASRSPSRGFQFHRYHSIFRNVHSQDMPDPSPAPFFDETWYWSMRDSFLKFFVGYLSWPQYFENRS